MCAVHVLFEEQPANTRFGYTHAIIFVCSKRIQFELEQLFIRTVTEEKREEVVKGRRNAG